MRADVFRWSAISAAVFLVLVVIGAILSGVSGVDAYQDDVAALLTDIEDNQGVFLAGSILITAGILFLLPLAVGLIYAHTEHDRPYAIIALVFIVIATAGNLMNGVSAIILSDVASNFVDAGSGAREALVADGELAQSFYIISFVSFFFPLGLSLAITGILMLRASFFAKPIAWATFVVAIGGLSGGFLWPIVIIGLPIWSILVGVTLWRKSAGPAVTMAAAGAPA